MNKNLLIVSGIVLVLLVGGGAVAFRHQIKALVMPTPAAPAPVEETTPTVTQTPAQTAPVVVAQNEVDYSATGFSPATLTVKKGTTVKFVNMTSGPMSVASNPHPTHTIYPEFDQYKSTFKGQKEYDFTFDKVGTWGYHNHANPSDGGTVVVTE